MLGKYTGRFEEAETYYARALVIAESVGRPDDAQASIWHNIGGVRHAAGRAEEAEGPARRAFEMRVVLHGADHPDTLADGAALAGVLIDLGRYDEAAALLTAGPRLLRGALRPPSLRGGGVLARPGHGGLRARRPGHGGRAVRQRRSTSRRRCWAPIIPSWP